MRKKRLRPLFSFGVVRGIRWPALTVIPAKAGTHFGFAPRAGTLTASALLAVIPANAGTQARSARAIHPRFPLSPSFQRKLEPMLILRKPGPRPATHGNFIDGSPPHRRFPL